MDFNATVDLIIRELNEAGEIIDDLKNYQGVPALQIELAKSKCRNAADVICLLKDMQGKTTIRQKEPESITFPEKQASAEQISGIRKPDKAERKNEPPQHESLTVKDELRKIHKKKTEHVIIADTFDMSADSLNEKLGSGKDDNDVIKFFKSKPIASLSESIGINDKFLFIRELFDGNSELYNKTISNLDNSASFSEAREIIIKYAGNDTENEAAKQLLELVKRKFPADE